MALAHVLAGRCEPEARRMTARPHDVKALADGDVQRAATACNANEHRIDAPSKPRPFLIAARASARLDASRRAGDLVEVSGVRRKRRVVHDATVAKGSDIPSRRLTPRSVGC
jgi:hypothetical protein